MLRITRNRASDSTITLVLEGNVASKWVAVLEDECLRSLKEAPEVVLDFSSVGYVDPSGVEAVGRLLRLGARAIHCPAGLGALCAESAQRRTGTGKPGGSAK